MEHEKDYSLLRPFDLEAAKRGDTVIDIDGDIVTYIGGPSEQGEFCVDIGSLGFGLCEAHELRMAPLAWVEGKPVYKGDVLYQPDFKFEHPQGVVITGVHANGNLSWKDKISGRVSIDGYSGGWSWTPPKVEKVKKYGWINIYPDRRVGNIFNTKKVAQDNAGKGVIDTIRISWKE